MFRIFNLRPLSQAGRRLGSQPDANAAALTLMLGDRLVLKNREVERQKRGGRLARTAAVEGGGPENRFFSFRQVPENQANPLAGQALAPILLLT